MAIRHLAAGAVLLVSACSFPVPAAQPLTPGAGGGARQASEIAPDIAPRDAPGDAAASAPITGWYMEHAGSRSLLPCAGAAALSISAPGELPARARAFGLEDDTPVYVRVHATLRNGSLAIDSVDQFGSPTPVRDCAMTGVVNSVPSATQ